MAHMNPRLELAPLDSILDVGVTNPALVATIARQLQRIAGRKAAAALRQRRRAPMAGLHLAAFGYTNLVATTVRRSHGVGAGGRGWASTTDAAGDRDLVERPAREGAG